MVEFPQKVFKVFSPPNLYVVAYHLIVRVAQWKRVRLLISRLRVRPPPWTIINTNIHFQIQKYSNSQH